MKNGVTLAWEVIEHSPASATLRMDTPVVITLVACPSSRSKSANSWRDVTGRFARMLLTFFDLEEIKRAFAETTAALLDGILLVDADISQRLTEPLNALIGHCDL